ncbi:hypothetical protein GXP67_23130 [Rhodocytophaga rosea]|uniref:BcpO-related WXXGXW repeat protein n=1 Tax=Rhodocytophaga rosea TaxID=2704465 RepID=A0A6C0GNA0_9BACT|nr:DUF6600 domain-containing protein [Rhodocytophaga rosea]QHT69324.1 hypothetical protein GXP67_23130 [Rhodocytophaga rosea]
MKIITKSAICCLFVLLAFSSTSPQKASAQAGANISFQTFYDELTPYGQWIVNPQHGSVWIPNVEPGFQPYATNGRWLMTEYGNTWVSDYVWGWAPFHYGRWFYDNYDGWCWIPGNEWGPAWVAWRSGGDYYGWAPLGPGININVNIDIPVNYWVFVPRRYIVYPHIYRYCVPRPRVVHIYTNTVYIHNTYRHNNRDYVCGPYRHDIERATRRSVPTYTLGHMYQPGRAVMERNSVAMYRPEVSPRSPRSSQPSPSTGRSDYVNPRTTRNESSPRTERNTQTEYHSPSYERNQPSTIERNPSSNRAGMSRREDNAISQDRISRNQTSSREIQSTPSTTNRQPARNSQQQRSNNNYSPSQAKVDRQPRVQRQQESSGSSSRQQNSSTERGGRARRN